MLDIWRHDVDQEISSERTCVRKIARGFRKISFVENGLNADIGGGRFDDATELLAESGVENVVFDPFNRSSDHNATAARRLLDGQADTATVLNVLNVISCPVARDRVIALAANAVGQDGVAWFQVYEGDASGASKATTAGWQENRRLASYLPEIGAHFAVAEIVPGGLIRAQIPYGEPWEAANEAWASMEQALDTGSMKVRHRYHGFDIWTDIAAAA